jgi:hypothetical protein
MRISNWTQFAKIFSNPSKPEDGPFMEGAYLAHSVYGFFQNGGSLCWVVRVGSDTGDNLPRAALPAGNDNSVEALRVVARDGITDQITLELNQEPQEEGQDGSDVTYRLVVHAGDQHEEHTGLSLKGGRRNVVTSVNRTSRLVQLVDTGKPLPETRLQEGTFTLSVPAEAAAAVEPGHFEGDVAKRKGMGGLAPVDEVTMLVMPDIMTLAVDGDGAQVRDLQGKMIAACEIAGDRMAILDAPPGLLPQDILEWRMNTAGYDSKMSALYYPWIEVMNPLTRRPMLVPPSGHVAGVWCRVDGTRGVHKAPANEVVLGANGLGFQVTHAEQGELNRVGINCIRSFPGRGIRIWGARTLSSDPEWRYINVRRLFNYIAESVMVGTQWSVFEPNDPRLWTQLQIAVSNFLTLCWRNGALFGATAGESFFVKCDAETNPPEVIEAGMVVCEIGIAPVKPAEFVVFRLSQFTGGGGEAEVSEE